MTTTTIVMLITTTPWYLARAFGVEPSSAMRIAAHDDSALLLHMDIVITVSHLLFPVRWIVLLPAEMAPLLLYAAVAIALGSSASLTTVAANIIIIALLNLAAALGRRQIERHERIAFAKVVHEKTRRVEVEHRLARIQESSRNAYMDDDLASDPTTAVTGELFQSMERANGDQAASRLQDLAKLGYKEHWLVPATDLKALPGDILGSGGFGMVLRAEYHGATVALKMSKSPCLVPLGGNGLTSLSEELRIFRRLRHPNIILFLGACISPRHGELMIVMECVHGMPLSDVVAPPPCDPSTHDRFTLAHGVACGLVYLHSQHPQIVHGDLKSSNVLVEKLERTVNAKIIDFGLSRLITRHAKPLGGTWAWMAPEVVMGKGIKAAPSADTFSFGRLLYMVMAGLEPLADVPRDEILAGIRQGRLHSMAWHEHVPMWKELKRLSESCTRVDPSQRPNIEQVRVILQTTGSLRASSQAVINIDDVVAEVRNSTANLHPQRAVNSSEKNMNIDGSRSSFCSSLEAAAPVASSRSGSTTQSKPAPHIRWPSRPSARSARATSDGVAIGRVA
eukprot:CAMPEP_0115681346 /NCGR_PEP_ID=MMETSP0272-20121206/57276_1 /TAXON_ID=71861 /ORGANISM="Scrippsiella trochoidea, Strain CCMP3099" /LENGTH=564 /DNA_ID=CAMNT_0003120657 /DNA_START=130 /DNA_END=1821 /DNA_ORIENTATION=+